MKAQIAPDVPIKNYVHREQFGVEYWYFPHFFEKIIKMTFFGQFYIFSKNYLEKRTNNE